MSVPSERWHSGYVPDNTAINRNKYTVGSNSGKSPLFPVLGILYSAIHLARLAVIDEHRPTNTVNLNWQFNTQAQITLLCELEDEQ